MLSPLLLWSHLCLPIVDLCDFVIILVFFQLLLSLVVLPFFVVASPLFVVMWCVFADRCFFSRPIYPFLKSPLWTPSTLPSRSWSPCSCFSFVLSLCALYWGISSPGHFRWSSGGPLTLWSMHCYSLTATRIPVSINMRTAQLLLIVYSTVLHAFMFWFQVLGDPPPLRLSDLLVHVLMSSCVSSSGFWGGKETGG